MRDSRPRYHSAPPPPPDAKGRPTMMTRARILIAAAALAAVAVAAAGVWWFALRDDAPPAVDLEGAVAGALATATAAAPDATAAPARTATPAAATPAPAATATAAAAAASPSPAPEASPDAEAAAGRDGLAGTWRLSERGDSFAGYRVREELANIGATTAVGRSRAVEAAMEFDGSAITAVSVVVDMTQLRSDDERRDRALGRQSLETNRYPTASFALAEPIPLGGPPAEGEAIEAVAVGDLTLHGVTRRVEIPIEGRFGDGLAVVVGSIGVEFADYGIDPPQSFVVLSVEDRGVMEFQLVFE